MRKVEKLFDKKYILGFFKKEVLPLYPDFTEIKDIKIQAYKKNIWDDTYHVVVGYETTFIKEDKQEEVLPIFCSAHSDEPRENVYKVLKFLWDHGFNEESLSIPHPLFFSPYFNGTFYRGAEGKNLYRYIRVSDFVKVEEIVPRAARWFAKLHNLSVVGAKNFNKMNSRIETVIPGRIHLLERIKEDHPEHFEIFRKAYDKFVEAEETFLASTKKRWLVHGDAHPENVIRMSASKLAVIDFTDLCLSDFARDIGTFLQQLEFMINRKIERAGYAEKIKKIFLDNYFKYSKIKLDNNLQKRIDNYYYWTSMRTAMFFLIKHNAEPERALPLIAKVRQAMNL